MLFIKGIAIRKVMGRGGVVVVGFKSIKKNPVKD